VDRDGQIHFHSHEGLERYVWSKAGKVLSPFERAERDQVQQQVPKHPPSPEPRVLDLAENLETPQILTKPSLPGGQSKIP
jgi:hypothetical protein